MTLDYIDPLGAMKIKDPAARTPISHNDWYALCNERDELEQRLAALELAAWDVHEAVSDALDTPEDADPKRIRKALDFMGELLPAQRPTDKAREVQPRPLTPEESAAVERAFWKSVEVVDDPPPPHDTAKDSA